MPLGEDGIADSKLINYLTKNSNKQNENYDIGSLLIKGTKHIDVNKHKYINEDIQHLARVKLFADKNPHIQLKGLPKSELKERISTITDQEVKDYVETLRNNIDGSRTNLEDVERLFTAEGLNGEEAKRLTSVLNTQFHIESIENLKSLSEEELKEAFLTTVRSKNISFHDFNKNINSFY